MSPRRRTTAAAVAAVVGVTAVSMGAWALQRWKPFADAPAIWPTQIAPIASGVENLTGITFERPYPIVFVDDKEMTAAVAADLDSDRIDPAVDELNGAVLRAFGLVDSGASVRDLQRTLDAAGTHLTWIDIARHRLLVRGTPDAELPPEVRTSVAFGLTIALVDDRFNVVARRSNGRPQATAGLGAATVGLGQWVADRYRSDLPAPDVDAMNKVERTNNVEYQRAIAGVPVSLVTFRSAGAAAGPVFIEAIQETGWKQLSTVFTSKPPSGLDQVALPANKYLTTDLLEPVAAPKVPAGARFASSYYLGSVGLFMLLTTGLPSNEALAASDGWGDDEYTSYYLGDVVCVDWHVVADNADAADLIFNGLNAWAFARPKASKARVGRSARSIYVSVCDPGAASKQPLPRTTDVEQFFRREANIRSDTDRRGDPFFSECVWVPMYAQFTLRQLDTGSAEVSDTFDTLTSDCRSAS